MKTKKKKKRKLSIAQGLALMYLKDIGTHTIVATFSGSGDDGGIEEVELFDFKEKNVSTDTVFNIQGYGPLEQLLYDCIDDLTTYEGDWVNNDGGYGTLTINLETNDYDLEVSFRTLRECAWDNQPFV